MKVDCVISDLADELTTLNEKYANCVRQLTEAHARIDRFEAEPKGWWHKEVEELKQQLAARDTEVTELTRSSNTYFAERNSARAAFHRASNTREELRQQLSAALDEARMANVSADEVRSTYAEEMRKLSKQLTDSQQQVSLLRGLIAIAALHVRPTCIKLYDDLTEVLAKVKERK